MSLGRPINLTANIASKSVSITATAEQTEFSPAGGYRIDQIAVYRNGTRLVNGQDFTARDGATVTLVSAATVGDTLEFQIFDSFNVANTINTNSSDQTINGSLTVTNGITGATIGIQSAGTVIGAGKTINFIGSGNTVSDNGDGSISVSIAGETAGINTSTTSEFTDISVSGVATVGGAVNITGAADGNLLNVSGITTVGILTVFDTTQSTSASTGGLVIHGGVGIAKSLFVDGNVTIGGTLTYEDMTNTDNLGFGTFRKGIEVQGAGSTTTTLNVTGVSTLSGDIRVPDDKKLHFGNIGGANGDLQLWHDAGQHSYIRDQGSGDLRIYGSAVDIRDNAGTASVARFTDNSVHLAGITTVGILTAYESITVKVGTGSTELTTALSTKASTGKAIAMAMVFGF